MTTHWRPRILVFACNWCSYTAADLAGAARIEMPADFTVVRVMCSGRVDPVYILHALARGIDGVLVSGCHPGDCHYTSGNLEARKRVDFLSAILDQLDLSDRLEMHYVSAAEGKRFGEVVTDFHRKITALGPSPLGRLSIRAADLCDSQSRTHPATHRVAPRKAKSEASRNDKRDAFRTLLAAIVEQLHATIPEGAAVPEELVVDGYAKLAYDPDSCLACGACAASCPQDNISIRDENGMRSVLSFQHRCAACGTCAEICPQEAVRVVPFFDLGGFLAGTRNPALQLELKACDRCGAPIATERQIEVLIRTLKNEGVDSDDPVLCQSCRRQAHAAEMRPLIAHLGHAHGGFE